MSSNMQNTDENQPLCVLLIDDDPDRAIALSETLDQSRYKVKQMVSADASLLKQVDELQPDIIIIDVESPNRDILESLHTLNKFNPKPIVMFSEQEDTNTINETVQSGVSAYSARDISPTRVRAILDTAVAQFQQMQLLRNQLEETQQALASQKVIDQAKTLLMETRKCTEKEAYQHLRKMAMDGGLRMEQVAKNVIDIIRSLTA